MPRKYSDAIYKDSVGALLRDPQTLRARRRSSGTPVKNYRLDNRANIKEIQAQNRQRREEEAAPAAEPFKLKQFKNVPSRFASTPAKQGRSCRVESSSGEPPGPPTHDFLKKGSREKETDASRGRRRWSSGGEGSSLEGARPRGGGSERIVTRRKEAVPKAGDVARLAPRSSRDFVAANRMKAVESKARTVSDRDDAFTHQSYGRVPDYLLSRQEEWEREAERRKAEAPDPSCPPGMKVMPDEERLETLRQLQANEATCQAQLNKFPLVVQTPLLQRRVDDLNAKLKEIDAAKAMFSRPKVYIARDT